MRSSNLFSCIIAKLIDQGIQSFSAPYHITNKLCLDKSNGHFAPDFSLVLSYAFDVIY